MLAGAQGQDAPSRTLITAAAPEPQTLGPGDRIQVKALHADELGNNPVQVDSEGYIMLPGLGRVRAGGLTTERLASDIRQRLVLTVRDPEVAIDLVELHSRPVSVLGAVKTPGVYQLVGQKRLLEILSLAGGLEQDAGDNIRITRAQSYEPEKQPGSFKVWEVRVSDLMEGGRPELNLVVHADDVITVPRARLVYVIGQVRKAGGFVLREQQSMSVLKALSLAEGLLPAAAVSNARILRQVELNSRRREIPVNIKAILAGKVPDQPLLPDDVLFVPNNLAKTVALRTLDTAVQMGTGLVIWRQH
jgi:polysaccharide biosynthesis/export protein